MQGRKPSAKEIADYSEAFRDAVKGQDPDFDRSSRHLQRVLVLGHPSDMLLYSVLKALKAIGRWAHYLTGIGWQASRDKWFASPVVDTLTKVLSQWHWRPRRGTWGVWQSPEGSWDVFSPKKAQDKGAHALRQSWRLSQVLSWFASSRNDAVLARSEQLRVRIPLISRLRALTRKTDGHGLAVMTGGVSSDARWCPKHLASLRHYCYDCKREITPHLSHVFWDCASTCEHCPDLGLRWPEDWVGVGSPTQLRY